MKRKFFVVVEVEVTGCDADGDYYPDGDTICPYDDTEWRERLLNDAGRAIENALEEPSKAVIIAETGIGPVFDGSDE